MGRRPFVVAARMWSVEVLNFLKLSKSSAMEKGKKRHELKLTFGEYARCCFGC